MAYMNKETVSRVVTEETYVLKLSEEEAQGLFTLLYYGVSGGTLNRLNLMDIVGALLRVEFVDGVYFEQLAKAKE